MSTFQALFTVNIEQFATQSVIAMSKYRKSDAAEILIQICVVYCQNVV